MRIVLADLAGRSGFVSKDTVAGGYGSRLRPFSKVTRIYCGLKRQFHDVPSVHMAYLAAIADRAGHDVAYTRSEPLDGDVALVLSSLVDHKQETAWADQARQRGVRAPFNVCGGRVACAGGLRFRRWINNSALNIKFLSVAVRAQHVFLPKGPHFQLTRYPVQEGAGSAITG